MDKFMALAYEEALSGMSLMHGGPFGALIVREGRIVVRSHNEVLLQQDPTAHAEVVAIRRACRILDTIDLSGCTLYATAKPCPMCKGAIQWSGIKEVVFSGDYRDTDLLGFGDSKFSGAFDREEEHWTRVDQEHFHTLIEKFEAYKQSIRY